MAVPTCLLLSLLGGRRLRATRAWGLSVVSGLLSVILSPGGTIVRLGARGCSRTPTSGHLCCGHKENDEGLAEEPLPCCQPLPWLQLAAHLASCSTPPRPWCSPAVGVLQAAEAAGLRKAECQGSWTMDRTAHCHPALNLPIFL